MSLHFRSLLLVNMTSSRSTKPHLQSRTSSMSSGPAIQTRPARPAVPEGCEDPRCTTPQRAVWFCVDCSVRYCDTCWSLCLAHQPGRTARDGIAHERTVFHEVERLREIMNPPSSQDKLSQMHESDEGTTWFGEYQSISECILVLTTF